MPILIAGLLTVSLSTYWYIHTAIVNQLTQSMLASTGKSADTIQHWLETLLLEPETIAATPAAREINRDFSPIDKQNISCYKLLHEKYPNMFLDVYAADRQGHFHTVESDRQGHDIYFKGDISDRDYFRSVMAGGPSQISPPLRSRLSGVPNLFVVAPIKDDEGHPIGLVGTGISLDFVKRIAAGLRTGKTGYGFIIARDGTFISHPDQDLVMRKRILDLADPSVRALGQAMLAGGSGSLRYRFNGEEKIAFFQPIRLTGWSVATTISAQELFAPATRMLKYSILVAVVVTLVVALMLILAASHMTGPLHQLARHAARIGEGTLPLADADIRSGDEVGALAATFNGMVRRLDRTLNTLSLSEQQFRSLAESSSDFILRFDRQGRRTYANPAAARAAGLAPAELLGRTLRETGFPEDMCAPWEQGIAGVFQTGAPAQVECRWHRPGGAMVVDMRFSPEIDAEGRVVSVLGVSRDITERKRIEEDLRASEKKFSSIFRLSPDAIDLTELETGVSLEVNACYEKMYGYSRAELLGHSTLPRDLGLWQDSADRQRHIAELKQHRISLGFEATMVRKDGSTFTALISSSLLEINGKLCNLSLARDITDRKQAEEALRRSEGRIRALIDAIPDVIFTYSREGEYLTVHASNPALLSMPAEQLLHRRIPEAIPEPAAGQLMATIARALDTGSVQEADYQLTLAGAEKHFEARVAPFTRNTAVAIVRDVTDKRRLEERQRELQAQLLQTQKMESLGSLAGGVAHDMNNVLGAILGLASAHLEAQPPGQPLRKALETIVQAAQRGGHMVQSLLSFARQRPAEERELDLNAVIREEVQLLGHTILARARLEMDLEPRLRPILGDEAALNHALMNLCVNAVDAMAENGTLTLRTRNRPGGVVEVQVGDTGQGMTREVLDKALDPFFTTKKPGKGTGLGLAMVYSTVKAHHGQMDIRSAPGQGTWVRLSFPAAAPAAPRQEAAAEAQAGSAGSLEVLLVDDDDLIRSSTLALLEALGHRARTAASGEEALALVASGCRPDLVILDLNMPGLGGAGTLPPLRRLLPGVPVLLATGRADQSALDLVASLPEVSLLPKPFGLADLRNRLASLGRA